MKWDMDGFCWSMIFSDLASPAEASSPTTIPRDWLRAGGKLVPTFRDHALKHLQRPLHATKRRQPASMTRPVFRFAPSPNGYLHLGHALSALINTEMARAADGRLLLRIEDIDRTRCLPEYEAAIYADLAWLGLAWEAPVRRQSEHFAAYREALDRLMAMGLVYPSFESRAEIVRLVAAREQAGPWRRDPDGVPLYPGAAKELSVDERRRRMVAESYALRLDMAAALARAGELDWTETGSAPQGETGRVRPTPRFGP